MKWKKEHAINPIYYTFLTGPVCARFNSLRYKKIKKVLITRKTKQSLAESQNKGMIGKLQNNPPKICFRKLQNNPQKI